MLNYLGPDGYGFWGGDVGVLDTERAGVCRGPALLGEEPAESEVAYARAVGQLDG